MLVVKFILCPSSIILHKTIMNSVKEKNQMFCNHDHNILRLFDVLPDFLFPISGKSVIISNKHVI